MDIKEKLMELINMGSGCPDGKDPFGDYCESCRYKESTMCHLESLADYLIDNGVTVADGKDTDVPTRWIPVTERLPEVATSHNTRWDKSTDSIRVLCACVQADGKKMVKEGYCKVYSDGLVRWKIPGTIHSVTHWMPLPEPPKGE